MSTATAFDPVAARYDQFWTESPAGRAQRDLVWREWDPVFGPGDRILDTGCGTVHRTLLDSRRDVWSIAWRRLLPASLPLRLRNNYFPEAKRTWSQWLRPSAGYVSYLLSRIVHHLLALPRAAASGARWWWCLHGTLPPERAQRSEEE
jgi:hypothetical protein